MRSLSLSLPSSFLHFYLFFAVCPRKASISLLVGKCFSFLAFFNNWDLNADQKAAFKATFIYATISCPVSSSFPFVLSRFFPGSKFAVKFFVPIEFSVTCPQNVFSFESRKKVGLGGGKDTEERKSIFFQVIGKQGQVCNV